MAENDGKVQATLESSMRNRVEEWITIWDESEHRMPRRSSMVRNVMYPDDILVVICPVCTVARLATHTKEMLNTVVRSIGHKGHAEFTGLVVASYCGVKTGTCTNQTKSGDTAATLSVSAFSNTATYLLVNSILYDTTIMPLDTCRSKIMLLNTSELVDLCRSMHRIPFRIGPENVVWPESDDEWTDMTWTVR